jgi:hypothetical protein
MDIRASLSRRDFLGIIKQFGALRLFKLHIRRLGSAAGPASLHQSRVFRPAIGAGPFQFNITDSFLCHKKTIYPISLLLG